jgi:uncharacterized protein YecE (DUF72 family)
VAGVTATVRLGTCSWADQGLIERWYPTTCRSAEARLRYYAERFDTVEVNASYYAIPDAATAQRWAERTPEGFVFHVKAFGLMTGHRVRPEQLPPDLRSLVDRLTSRGNVEPTPELTRRVFERFAEALDPLRSAGKLGGVLMQYPPSLAAGSVSRAFIEESCGMLGDVEALVEFRERTWLGEDQREATLGWLEDRGLTYVAVDAPAVETANVSPTVIASTSATAYVRFHGRNAATWNVTGGVASDRFDHYYDEAELDAWSEPLRELARSTTRVYAMFNTNNADQGPINAALLRRILARADVPVAPEPGPAQGALF